MSEKPYHTIVETPVLDPNLFLLHHANRAFVERRNNHPILDEASQRSTAIALGIALSFPLIIALLILNSGMLPLPYASWLCGFMIVLVITIVGGYGYYLRSDLRLKGWILPGAVVRSEKIRWGKNSHERFGVWYRFVDPNGDLIEGYAEADSDTANRRMAPLQGTEVRIWYDDNGKCYLL